MTTCSPSSAVLAWGFWERMHPPHTTGVLNKLKPYNEANQPVTVGGGRVDVLGAAVVVGTGVAGGKVVVLGAAVVVGTGVAAAEGQIVSYSRLTPRCRRGQQMCWRCKK